MAAAPDQEHRPGQPSTPGQPRSAPDAAFLGRPAGDRAGASDAVLQALVAEVSALRLQVEALTARVTGTLPGPAPREPTAGDDAPD